MILVSLFFFSFLFSVLPRGSEALLGSEIISDFTFLPGPPAPQPLPARNLPSQRAAFSLVDQPVTQWECGGGVGGTPTMKPTFLKPKISKCYFIFFPGVCFISPLFLICFFFFACTVMIVYIHLDVVCFACSKTCDRDMQVDRYNFILYVNFFVNKLCLWKKNKIKTLSKS